MKKFFLSFLMLASFSQLFAQNNTTGVITASEFHVTRPLREIFAENPVDENKIYTEKGVAGPRQSYCCKVSFHGKR